MPLPVLLLFVAALLAGFPGQAATTAEVAATHPGSRITLGRQENFWVRIAYATDETVSLWARPYRNGSQVREAYTNASLPHAGTGEALGWFALTGPGTVDEVRIVAGGGQPYREWEVARYPVDLRWTAGVPSPSDPPPWVADLLAVEQSRYAEAAAQRAAEPVSGGELALFNGFMLFVLALLLAGIGVPVWHARKWQGGWRIAALVPSAIMAFVVLRILFDTALDPTSHNLWPFEILQAGIVGLAWIGVLRLARKWQGIGG